MVDIQLDGELEDRFEAFRAALSDQRDRELTNEEVAELLVEAYTESELDTDHT